MHIRNIITVLALALLPAGAFAQSDDFGIWTSVGVEKKVSKKLTLEGELELRTRNNTRTADRWSGGIAASYKLARWLKAAAGYSLLYDNNQERLTFHDDGTYNNWMPSYWGVRHRFNIDLGLSRSWGHFGFSLRERWQYTYRPEKTATRYDFDNLHWEDKAVDGKAKNVLRSRLQVKYDKPKCKWEPYASVELFNAWNLQKVRYTAGLDWKLSKQHHVGLFYRYQNVSDDDEPNRHILGLNYQLKLK